MMSKLQGTAHDLGYKNSDMVILSSPDAVTV